MQAATEKRLEAEAHVIRGVDVLEHDEQRLREGEVAEQPREGLEQAQVVSRFDRRRPAGVQQFGKQARELREPGAPEAVEGARAPSRR